MKLIRDTRKVIWTYRQKGFKNTVKDHGWGVFLGIFLFYLIRDSLLYIVLPYFLIILSP